MTGKIPWPFVSFAEKKNQVLHPVWKAALS